MKTFCQICHVLDVTRDTDRNPATQHFMRHDGSTASWCDEHAIGPELTGWVKLTEQEIDIARLLEY